ncbi:MAG TPA: protein kinase [Kofleriaceae bacterium]|nr:protein kinase [Kofleriaceae bacterium]
MLEVGCVIDGYRIVALHAIGGMAAVYRAEDVATGRRVALKVSDARYSLAHECAALAAISSPHVVGYITAGMTDGLPFVVVDWLDGDDLRTILARGAMPIDATIRIATELCRALAAVHAAGYVHRDLKPANVIVAAGGATLLDFGLAQRIGPDRLARLGTAAYLAPELVVRSGHAIVDPRGDLYALGCMVFECLAGVPPFETGNAAEILLRQLLEPVARVRTLRPEVPLWLDELVDRLLRKEPGDRPRDGAELLAAFEAGAAGAGVTAATRADHHAHAFALVRVGEASSHETIELDHDAVHELAAICRSFALRVHTLLDVIVLTASDADPRDQLRRLLGASVRIVAERRDVSVAIVTGATHRGHALLARVPLGTAYADDETRRIAPAGCAQFTALGDGTDAHQVTAMAASPATPTTLVGRDEIIRRLRAVPRAGFAILLGEAGMGKSAILEAVRSRLATSRAPLPSVIEGQLHLAGAPYHAMRVWFTSWCARIDVVDEATLRAALVRRLGRRGALHARELARLLDFAAVASPPANASRDLLESAIVDGLDAALADDDALVVDNAQWLDSASAAALVRWLDRADRPRLLLAARPELRTAHAHLVARATIALELEPLDVEHSTALVARSAPGLTAAEASAIVRDAEGHPLILLELAHAAVTGVARAHSTAIGLVQARLLTLSRGARHVLATAAAIGGTIARDLLGATHVDELVAANILAGDRDDPRWLRFTTALVEEAAYALIPADERRAVHAAIARAFARDAATEPAVLYRHAVGADDLELVTLAHVLAAERAVRLLDFEAARDAACEGVASGATGELLARLRLCESESLLVAERYAEADVRAREAAEHLAGGSMRWAFAASVRTRAVHRRLEPAASVTLFDELAALTCDAGPPETLRLQCLIQIAASLILTGHLDKGEARSVIVEGLATTQVPTAGVDASLYALRGRRAHASGDWDRSRDQFEHAAVLHDRNGNLLDAVMARLNVAHACFELGEVERAIEVTRGVVAEATELELPFALGYARFLLGCFLRREGTDLVAARAQLERALEDGDEDPRRAGEIAVELALDALDRDDVALATRHADRASELLARAPTHIAQTCAVRALVCLRAGDIAAAQVWVERARVAIAPLGIMVEDLSLVRAIELEVCLAARDPRTPEYARIAFDELADRERRLVRAELVPRFRARADHARLRALVLSITKS